MCNYIWVKSIFAADGYTPVLILPKPKKEFAEKAGIIKGVTVIGKLDIVWKTNLGERGRLQTSQLQRMAPGYGDVRLSLEAIPDTVNLEEPFHITCKITNCSERTMDLVLEMCNTNSIHWCGISGRQLGKLHPSSSLPCPHTTVFSTRTAKRLRLKTNRHILKENI